MFLKYGRKVRAEFLEAAIFFRGFPVLMASSFKISFADMFRNMHFLQCDSIYRVYRAQKTAVGSVHEVLAESLKTVFDEAHFIANLQSFLQSLALPRQTFSPSESFPPSSRQNNFQNSPSLETSATALVSFPQF